MPSSTLNITTATFFKGKVPSEDLERRITELVQANPWLECRLKKEVGPSVWGAWTRAEVKQQRSGLSESNSNSN